MRLVDIQYQFEQKYSKYRVGAGASAMVQYENKWYFVIDSEKWWNDKYTEINGVRNFPVTFGCAGGTVEPKETIVEALHRELIEEMSIEIEIEVADKSYYLDQNLNITTLSIEDLHKPILIYEHRFQSPEREIHTI